MTLTPKEMELVAIGISVAAGCKPCTDHHVTVATKVRATGGEIRQAIDEAVAIRRSAADIMEAHALAHLGEAREVVSFGFLGEPSRIKALVSVGAAFAVNCVSSMKHHLTAAELSGVSKDDISEIVKLAAFIKQKAASHVERYLSMTEKKAAA